jgi:chorismate mutase
MKTLDAIRKEIDAIDTVVMEQLNLRFSLMKDIKIIKQNMGKGLVDASREQMILKKTEIFEHQKALIDVYLKIMEISKDLQNES